MAATGSENYEGTALISCRIDWLHRWLRFGWVSDLILGSDPRQKLLGIRFLVGWANCAVGVIALNFGASLGVIDRGAALQLTWAALVTQAFWYAVLRAGLNRSFDDPSLSEALRATVIVFLAWGYGIANPEGRPVALMLLFMMMMFGMFVSTTRQLVRSSVLACITFGLAMRHVAHTEGDLPNTVEMQWVYFAVMLTMLISVCLLVAQLNGIRDRSAQRKASLQAALEQLGQLATRDELTGLYNRRHMSDVLQAEKLRVDRHERPFTVCLIDVDHFKSVNDRFGHAVGDDVLRAVAGTLADGLRDTDVVARWGGEEFLVLCPDTDDEGAARVVDRVRRQLASEPVSQAHPDLRVSYSAGLATHLPGEDWNRTLERADQALYQAKRTGRQRTEIAPRTAAPAEGPAAGNGTLARS